MKSSELIDKILNACNKNKHQVGELNYESNGIKINISFAHHEKNKQNEFVMRGQQDNSTEDLGEMEQGYYDNHVG